MAPLPPDSILRAAARWLQQLRHSPPDRARAMFTAHPRYGDLTLTQYEAGLDWLKSAGLVSASGTVDQARFAGVISDEAVVLEAALEHACPPWVRDADRIIGSADDLPDDLVGAAECLNLDPQDGLAAVRQVWGKVDTSLREEIGSAGEVALAQLLACNTAAEVIHVAAQADGYGFDIVVRSGTHRANLEVKSTTRRGRLSIYLSRNEYEVMRADPNWHLVVLLLDDARDVTAIGSVSASWVRETAPVDSSNESSWQSARFDVPPGVPRPGLTSSLPWALPTLPSDHILATGYRPGDQPAWLQYPISP